MYKKCCKQWDNLPTSTAARRCHHAINSRSREKNLVVLGQTRILLCGIWESMTFTAHIFRGFSSCRSAGVNQATIHSIGHRRSCFFHQSICASPRNVEKFSHPFHPSNHEIWHSIPPPCVQEQGYVRIHAPPTPTTPPP